MFFSSLPTQSFAFLSLSHLIHCAAMPLQDALQTPTSLARDATVKLFPPTSGLVDIKAHGSSETFYLASETCLSGDYHHNLQFISPPKCASGEIPTLLVYPRTSCTGKPNFKSDRRGTGNDIPVDKCLFSEIPKNWSLIFRCRIWPTLVEGAERYVTVVPPVSQPASQDHQLIQAVGEKASDGVISMHFSPTCNNRRLNGNDRMKMPVQKCFSNPSPGLRILHPAICADGTRAKLARFSDQACSVGFSRQWHDLLDAHDSDINTCLETGKIGGVPVVVKSFAFLCDDTGPSNRKPTPRKASISVNACAYRSDITFQHPATDSCVNLSPGRPHPSIKIYSPGTCPNGTTPLLARYSLQNCRGSPQPLTRLLDDELHNCLSTDGILSLAFWCTGNIDRSMLAQPKVLIEPVSQSKHRCLIHQGSAISWKYWFDAGIWGLLVVVVVLNVWRCCGFGKIVRSLFGPKYGPIAL